MDHSMERPCPASGRSGTPTANTVTFRIPRSYLAGAKVTAPYDVFALTSYRAPTKLWTVVADDRAPDAGAIGVAAPAGDRSAAAAGGASPSGSGSASASVLDPIVLERPGGNTFTAADSTLGVTGGPGHEFSLSVPESSTVELLLGGRTPATSTCMSRCRLGVRGLRGSARASRPRRRPGRPGHQVDPYMVLGVPSTNYTLRPRRPQRLRRWRGHGLRHRR